MFPLLQKSFIYFKQECISSLFGWVGTYCVSRNNIVSALELYVRT